VLQGCCRGVAGVLQGCCRGVTGVCMALLGRCMGLHAVTGVLQGHECRYRGATKVSKDVAGVVQRHYRSIAAPACKEQEQIQGLKTKQHVSAKMPCLHQIQAYENPNSFTMGRIQTFASLHSHRIQAWSSWPQLAKCWSCMAAQAAFDLGRTCNLGNTAAIMAHAQMNEQQMRL